MHPDDYWNMQEMDQAISAYHEKVIAPQLGKIPKDVMEKMRRKYIHYAYQSSVAIWAIAKWWVKEGQDAVSAGNR